MNIRLEIEYDGAPFFGWQRQLNKPTVQACVEDAIAAVVGRRTVLYGASRTDAGAHARGQVANFFAESRYEGTTWRGILNDRLPHSIRILASQEVADSFHAQRDAISKQYEYVILHRSVASAFDCGVYHYPAPLDWDSIRAALPILIGTKDFRAFQGSKASVLSTVRTIHRFDLIQDAPNLYRFIVEGNGFLKQMVRTMVGTVIEVGEGRRTVESLHELFKHGDRRKSGRTIPAAGLVLVKIHYPESFEMESGQRNNVK